MAPRPRARAATGALLALCCLALSAAACAPDAPAARAAPTVRDSAGIRIVAQPGDPRGTGSLTLELLWTHGHGAGDYAFQLVGAGALLPDGGAVLSDAGNREVVAVGPDGRSAGVLAGTGQGPGEVRSPFRVHAAGPGAVWVEDDGNQKIVLFRDGELSRIVAMQGAELGRGLMTLGLDPSGRFLMVTSSFRPPPEPTWIPGHLVVFDPDGRRADTVGTIEMALSWPREGVNPFGPTGFIDEAGGRFVHARTDRPELVWRAPDGSVVQVVRWVPEPAYPTEQDWEAFHARMQSDLERMNPGLPASRLREIQDEQAARFVMRPDEPLPLFGPLTGDDRGGVWLAHFAPVTGRTPRASRYEVVSAEGDWLGTADFGRPFFLLDVRDERALGVTVDEMEVQAVAVYRIGVAGAP